MAGAKITAFFRPSANQETNPSKRPLSEETNHSQRRSKSPKIFDYSASPLPIRTDSPNAKRVESPLVVSQANRVTEGPAEISAVPSDSDMEDTIVVQVPQRFRRKMNALPQSSLGSSSDLRAESFNSASSHRIERYGQTLITGSDDSDSDTLLDLDDLLGRKPVRVTFDEKPQQTQQFLRKPTGKAPGRRYIDTTKADAALFDNLMKQAHSDIQSNQDSKEAVKSVDGIDDKQRATADQSKQNGARKDLTVESIIARLGDTDPDEAEKFTQAIERTELTHVSYKWSFFNVASNEILQSGGSSRGIVPLSSDSEGTEADLDTEFEGTNLKSHSRDKSSSVSTLVNSSGGADNIDENLDDIACERPEDRRKIKRTQNWRSTRRKTSEWPEVEHQPGWAMYKDSAQREIAFIGGVFEQAAADGQLPEELYLWIMRQSFYEPNAHLQQAYRRILDIDSKSIKSGRALKICQMGLKDLGATEEAMDSSGSISKLTADSSDANALSGVREPLETWLQNIPYVTSYMTSLDRARLLEHLLTLTLDSAVASNASLIEDLQHALDACLGSFEDNAIEKTTLLESLQKVFDRAGDAHFRLQCATIMPVYSQKSSRLRRRLALATFYEDKSHLDHDPPSTFLHSIRQHLVSHKQFQMTAKTDYRKIVALFSCLDIAIADGNAPKSSEPAIVKQFNESLDELANTIQSKYARIQANGAAHISRTQSKDILEAIERRLRYAVRTKAAPKANPFKQPTLDSMVRKHKTALLDRPSERASVIA